ncbi:MAG: hypothetical protein WD733_07925 [Bryobacterales bacterium]
MKSIPVGLALLITALPAAAQTKIDLARQAKGAIPEPVQLEYLFAGVTQNGNAGWYVSSGSSNAPTISEVSQTAPYATLVFGPCSVCNGSDDITGYLWLPKIAERWDGSDPSLAMRFRTTQTSQGFTVAGVAECAATGSAGNPAAFNNTAGTFSLTSPGTANQWFDATVATLDLSGCDPQDALWIRVQRTDNNAGSLQIVWASLTMGVRQ